MINSFLNHTKTPDNQAKNSHLNSIHLRDRRFNNGNNDTHILRSIQQKKNYNNHRFYSNNENDENKVNNLSEMYTKFNRWDLYKSNSKSKKDENTSNNNLRTSFISKNNNYNNINNNNAYHSFDKNEKTYTLNAINNNNNIHTNNSNSKNKNINIKLIENEMYTPRNNNKSKNFVDSKYDLSKTLNNFKNRDNYGYHEIKDVKKNNIVQANTEKKNNNKNPSNYLSINISNNNSFRHSLNINSNGKNNTNIINSNKKNYNYNNYNQKNEQNNNPNEINNNRKFSFVNYKTAQNYFKPPKNAVNAVTEDNNYCSYNNIKDSQKNNIKDNNIKFDNNQNIKKQLLIRKIYSKNANEEKKPKNEISSNVNYIKRNDLKNNKISTNNKEIDKSNVNANRYFSGDLKEIIKNVENEKEIYKINNDEKKLNNLIINKDNSPIKKEYITKNYIKQKSYSNYNASYTEKKIQKKNEQYDINNIFKKVEKNHINKIQSKNIKKDQDNEAKKSNINVINEKVLNSNSKDKNNNSILLKNNNSLIKINLNNNNTSQQNQKSEIKNINTKNVKFIDNKDIKKNSNKNNIKQKQKHKQKIMTQRKKNNNNKNNSIYINPFNNENYIRKDLTTEKKNYKDIIKKKCKSIEKNDKKDKEELMRKTIDEVKRQKSSTKTKSKAKKHSNKVKYLDKLKIFKYPEIYYDSTTNCSKENIDYRYKKIALRTNKTHSKEKKNINSFNLNIKTFEEDFKINQNNINEKYQNLKPQISVRITLSKKNNVNITGIIRYFKVNYFCSENLRNKYDFDSEDSSEFYNAKF